MGDGCTWKNAIEQLRQIGKEDHAFVRARLISDRSQARNTVAGLYVRYIYIGIYARLNSKSAPLLIIDEET